MEKQATKPQVSERKESLLALPSESGFVKTKGIKRQALLADNVNNAFERNSINFFKQRNPYEKDIHPILVFGRCFTRLGL